MRVKRWSAVAPALVALLGLVADGSAHPSGHVIANGGLTSSGGGRVLSGTVGQAAVGLSTGPASRLCHGYWCFGGSRVVSVDPQTHEGLPKELSFGPGYPNPSGGIVRFTVGLPSTARVQLMIYDVAGRMVGDPLDEMFDAGYHRIEWSGTQGHAGVYFARLLVDGRQIGERRIVRVE